MQRTHSTSTDWIVGAALHVAVTVPCPLTPNACSLCVTRCASLRVADPDWEDNVKRKRDDEDDEGEGDEAEEEQQGKKSKQ